MRLPFQAPPVTRGLKGVRKPATMLAQSSCFGSCLISAINKEFSIPGIERCANITSFSAFASCLMAVMQDDEIMDEWEAVVALAAADAVGCGAYCIF